MFDTLNLYSGRIPELFIKRAAPFAVSDSGSRSRWGKQGDQPTSSTTLTSANELVYHKTKHRAIVEGRKSFFCALSGSELHDHTSPLKAYLH